MKYIGAGTVSVLGFLLATACGQGGPGDLSPPSVVDDDVPNGYEEPPFDGESDPPNYDDPPSGGGSPVPGGGDPPPGGGACVDLCNAAQRAGCLDGDTAACASECEFDLGQEACADQVVDLLACLYANVTSGACEAEALFQDEALLSICQSQVNAYGTCLEQIPAEPTQQCLCSCACEELCTGTSYITCQQSDTQCQSCQTSCTDFCASSACGAAIQSSTQAYCVATEQ